MDKRCRVGKGAWHGLRRVGKIAWRRAHARRLYPRFCPLYEARHALRFFTERTQRGIILLIQSMTRALAAMILTALGAHSIAGQTDFYRGKTVEIDVGTGVGGGYDANA